MFANEKIAVIQIIVVVVKVNMLIKIQIIYLA